MDFKKPINFMGVVGYEVLGLKIVGNGFFDYDLEKLKEFISGLDRVAHSDFVSEIVKHGLFQFIEDKCISPIRFWQKEDFEAKIPKDKYILCREKQNGAFTGWLKLKVK